MTQLDLPDQYLKQLLGLLQAHVSDAEVWAYGSRLNGRGHATSDLDLVLRNPTAPSKAQPKLRALRDALSESRLPILVDVLDWARIPDSFRKEIEREHVLLREPFQGTRS